MWQCKVCLSMCLNISFRYKSLREWSIVTEFEYIFSINILSLFTKNCDRILAAFYRDVSKSIFFSHFCFIVDKNEFNYEFLTTINLIPNHVEDEYTVCIHVYIWWIFIRNFWISALIFIFLLFLLFLRKVSFSWWYHYY